MAGILIFEEVEMPLYFSSLKKSIFVKSKLVLTLLLIQESNGLWTEPGGKKEPNEKNEHTAARETQEEFCNFIRIDPKNLSSEAQVTLKSGYKAFLVIGACRGGFFLKYYKKNKEKILKELETIETKLKSYNKNNNNNNNKRKSATTKKSNFKNIRMLEDKKHVISSWNETKNISRVAVDKILLAVLSQANSEEKKTHSQVFVRDLENKVLLLHSRTVAVLQECLKKQLLKLPLKTWSRSLFANVFVSPNIPKIFFRVSKFKTVASKDKDLGSENKLEFLNGTMSYNQGKNRN